ncbi:DUF1579 domain-containing protein [Microlunatus antarcticus]|uniref:DUF1579 domain-containing protein n=1 Tax=Microlunatus antarcticus TaxID=53388 RepID=A0A7W5JYH9_9ACTN|nr:DUF1579 domain-containing protein [Microlunatus antarcticus]MBB3328663.1 hypothetical protein [Microlunatus antarcticus]
MILGERFWDLLGNWSGVEEQSASPWAPAARTRAALTFKLDLGGTVVVQDYRQVRDDGAEFLAHGVFLGDAGAVDDAGVRWWLFDSFGNAPEPGRGRWAGGALELVRATPRGSAHHRFELDGGRLAYAIDVALGDQEAVPFLRGRYERVSGH